MRPGLHGVGLLRLLVTTSVEGAVSVPKRYPEEFRRKVLDLVASGRPVAQIAADLGISDQTIYGWRKQELIDTGSDRRRGIRHLTEKCVAELRVNRATVLALVLLRGEVVRDVRACCCAARKPPRSR